ncbi:hypothetical protein HDV02_003490 [Globomyces sp. JEL0801]|nr:hypothetical protein HDV02_003490 [Globomyces sp. JEL0801]
MEMDEKKSIIDAVEFLCYDLKMEDLNSTRSQFVENRLVHLDLSQLHCQGNTIPILDSYTELRHLNLANSNFNGELTNFKFPSSLVYLNLESNSFRGELPDFPNNTNLLTLKLNNNSFTGSFPPWSGLKSLTALDVSNNSLNQTDFPPEWKSTVLRSLKCQNLICQQDLTQTTTTTSIATTTTILNTPDSPSSSFFSVFNFLVLIIATIVAFITGLSLLCCFKWKRFAEKPATQEFNNSEPDTFEMRNQRSSDAISPDPPKLPNFPFENSWFPEGGMLHRAGTILSRLSSRFGTQSSRYSSLSRKSPGMTRMANENFVTSNSSETDVSVQYSYATNESAPRISGELRKQTDDSLQRNATARFQTQPLPKEYNVPTDSNTVHASIPQTIKLNTQNSPIPPTGPSRQAPNPYRQTPFPEPRPSDPNQFRPPLAQQPLDYSNQAPQPAPSNVPSSLNIQTQSGVIDSSRNSAFSMFSLDSVGPNQHGVQYLPVDNSDPMNRADTVLTGTNIIHGKVPLMPTVYENAAYSSLERKLEEDMIINAATVNSQTASDMGHVSLNSSGTMQSVTDQSSALIIKTQAPPVGRTDTVFTIPSAPPKLQKETFLDFPDSPVEDNDDTVVTGHR